VKSIWTGGLLIGILCAAWMLIMGVTGWYKDPVMLNAFWLVILIQLGVMIWGLRANASTGATLGRLVLAGTLMSVVAAVFLFIFSYVYTTVIFPSYFEDLRMAQMEILRQTGMPEEQVFQQVELTSMMQTPFIQALSGFMGTIVTGVIFSLIIGFFVRKKSQTA
jgi:hypothetical protein